MCRHPFYRAWTVRTSLLGCGLSCPIDPNRITGVKRVIPKQFTNRDQMLVCQLNCPVPSTKSITTVTYQAAAAAGPHSELDTTLSSWRRRLLPGSRPLPGQCLVQHWRHVLEQPSLYGKGEMNSACMVHWERKRRERILVQKNEHTYINKHKKDVESVHSLGVESYIIQLE